MPPDPAFTLAEHVCQTTFAALPATAVRASKRDILDTLGAALGGSVAPGVAELTRVIIPLFGAAALEIGVEATQPLPRRAFFVVGRPPGMDTVFTQPVSTFTGWMGVGLRWR